MRGSRLRRGIRGLFGRGTVVALAAAILVGIQSAQAAFPGANGKIAFVRGNDIYTVNADGTGEAQLTSGAPVEYFPDFSADQSKIVFKGEVDGNAEIFTMNADGSSVTRLTEHAAHDTDPAWSPDGTKIAFTTNRSENWDIYVMNANGTGVTQLTTATGTDWGPEWSPDGTKIVFWYSTAGGQSDIYVMNANGTGRTQLTNAEGQEDYPDWSPDGSKIVYGGTGGIRTINADGSSPTSLGLSGYRVKFSPDGTKIVYVDDNTLFVANANGSSSSVLVSNGEAPDWGAIVAPPDTTPPDTTITSAPAGYVQTNAVSFSFTSTEAGTFACKLDGGSFQTCTSPHSLTGLAEGAHKFQVKATDTASNTDPTPAVYHWSVDTVPARFGAPVDQHYGHVEPPGGLSVGGPTDQRMAQIFTPGVSGRLVEARILLFCDVPRDLTLEVQGVAAGRPDGAVLASATISVPDPGNLFRRFVFWPPPALTAGTGYALVLSGPAESGCGAPFGFSNPYPDPLFVRDSGDATWAAATEYTVDLGFATFVGGSLILVTSTADSGPGTLRQAILDANGNADTSTIGFAIGEGGAQTIQPTVANPLPALTAPVVVDGTTQPGYAGAPLIRIDGELAATNGLTVNSNSTVSGLMITGFSANGIVLTGNNNTVSGNYVGTDGTADLGNGASGVLVQGTSNTIGGSTPASRNVISGNGVNGVTLTGGANTIEGNYIGTNALGAAAIGNDNYGVRAATGDANAIGGTTPAERNVISGNGIYGVYLQTQNNTVFGNYIGTNAAGTASVPNGTGVTVVGANNQIGQPAAGGGNVISGNSSRGINIFAPGEFTIVRGNAIGTDVSGTNALPNAEGGILVFQDVNNIDIGGRGPGEGNHIAHNGLFGVAAGNNPTGVEIVGNSIHDNTASISSPSSGLGIDLLVGSALGVTENDSLDADAGANNLQNFPVLASAVKKDGFTRIKGTLNSLALTPFDVDFYSSPTCDPSGNGEGKTWLGFAVVITDGLGDATINTGTSITAPTTSGHFVTATATDPYGNTSEFSDCTEITDGITVTTTANTGAGTLRAAIEEANAEPGPDTILFNIPGPGVKTISPTSPLPIITDPVSINGLSQSGAKGPDVLPLASQDLSASNANLLIELDGSLAGGENGLEIQTSNSSVKGLVINDFFNGIALTSSAATNNSIHTNFIGTNAAGTAAQGNTQHGVEISSGAANNKIGKEGDGAGNVISGNGDAGVYISGANGNQVMRNVIGLDVVGTENVPNARGVVVTSGATSNTIGDTLTGRSNFIAGQTGNGVELLSSGNTVQNNFAAFSWVNTDGTLFKDMANGGDGVLVTASNNNVLANTIANNGGNGVTVVNATGVRITGPIRKNGGLGIDLGDDGVTANDLNDADAGPNNLQNFPVLTSASQAGAGENVAVAGTLNSAANTTYTIDLYVNRGAVRFLGTGGGCDPSGFGEGQGGAFASLEVTTNDVGNASFSTSVAPPTEGEDLSTAVITATATGPGNNTSEFSQCTGVTAPVEDLSLTVEETALPTGWGELPLSEIPNAALPFFAGPLSAPVGSTPVGSTPVGSTPVGSTPVGSTPVGSTPVGSTPVGSTPVGSTPVGSTGLTGTPVGSTPLQFVLASSVPIDWGPIVQGSGLAGRPTQTFTLQDVFNDSVASANFANNVTIGQAALENTVLSGVSWASLLIGNKTVADVPAPGGTAKGQAAWLAFLDDDTGVTDATTMLGLDVAGRLASSPVGSTPVGSTPVGSTPVGSTKVGDITGGIAGTPVGSTPVGSTFFNDTRLGEVKIAAIDNEGAVVDCSLVDCVNGTLADAKAAGAILSSATLADLAPAINHFVINELVIAIVGRNGLPWEAFPVSDFSAYVSPQTLAHYRAQLSVACPLSTLQVRILLPFHFILKPGTSQLSVGGGPLQPIADPATDAATGATYSLSSSVCPSTGPSQTLDLRFEATTGSRVGTLLSTIFVTRDGKTSSASSQAPLAVQERGEPDESSPPIIQPNKIYLRHTPTTSDEVDKFRLPIPPENTVVRIFLGQNDIDRDLILQVPAESVQSAPVGSTPVGSTPIEDRGTSITGQNPALPAEGLQDIPVGSTPVGSTPVGSTSINRGTADEVVEVVSDGEAGFYTIHVIPYNGATSADGYTLRVQEIPPPTLPPCPARVFPFDSDPDGPGGQAEVGVSLPDPASLPNATKTLFLMLDNQLRDLYGTAAVNSLLAAPGALANASAHPQVQGVTLKLDANAAVKQEIQDLNANPCASPDDFVKAVNDALTPYRNALPNLKYLVFLGTNEAFPMGWKRDRVTLSNATDYAANLLFTTQNGTQANASYAAAFTGHVLTDDVYTSLTARQFLGESFPLPDLSSGRLLETPAEMAAQAAQFDAANGQLDASTIQTYTASYDFLLDGGTGVNTTFENTFGLANTLARLTNTWDAAQVQTDYFSNAAPRSVGAVWGHYDHYRMQPATGATLVSTESVDDATTGVRFPGRVLFTVGCNAGQNVADTLIQNFSSNPTVAADQQERLRDWAQAWGRQKTAVYLANTSFGYGDTDFVALSEKLGNLFAARLPESTTMGEKFVAVKHDYFNQMGTYGVFDEKALVEWTLYGFPQWKLSAGTAPAPPTPPSTTPGPGSLQSATINLTSTDLAKQQVNSDRGTFWRAADGSTHSQPYRQPQSVHDFDETVPGLELRGALFKSLATTNFTVNPHLHIPTIDAGGNEPERRGFTETFFPANFLSVTRTGGRDVLTVVDTQQRPTTPVSANVVTRLVTALGVQLLYAPSSSADGAPPLFLESGLIRSGQQATLFARMLGDPILVEALVTQNGVDWQLVSLTNTPGTNIWTATITLAAANVEASAFFNAANALGRVAYTTDKGDLHQSVPAPIAAGELSVLIETPPSGAFYSEGQVVNADYGCNGPFIVQCAGPVADGAPINTATIGEKAFAVTARNVNGASRTRTHRYMVYGRILFTRGSSATDIYAMNVDGSGVTQLTTSPANDAEPEWSPNGSKIAFTSDRDGDLDIYVMNADGTGVTQLANHSGVDISPTWSPDGTKIAFASNRGPGTQLDVYVMNADGTGVTRLTTDRSQDFLPSWSPDGTKIAFSSGRSGGGDIYVMNADGSGQTRLTTHGAPDSEPAWSPDGSKIAFSSNRDGGTNFLNFDVYVMNADGSGTTRLTDASASDLTPAWSHDGTKIVFASNRDGFLNFEVYRMNADGTGVTPLTNRTGPDLLPDW